MGQGQGNNTIMERTISDLHQSLMHELRALRKISEQTNILESDSMSMLRCLQSEISAMKQMSDEQRNQRVNQRNVGHYPDLRAD